ncbi:MAG TPA: hypothetical protein VGG32_08585 [Thermoplasmata archaeon]|jgi:hypothetical protein
MIPAHKIRPNETSRLPRRFVILDTEAVEEGETQRTQTWRLAVTAYTHADNRRRDWSPFVYRYHRTPDELWDYVESVTRRRRRCVVVAHNLAYDLRIARAFHDLPRRGWSLASMGLHDRSLTVTFRREDRSLVFVDSRSWWPTSVEGLGLLQGLPKLDLPGFDEPDEVWRRRCQRDVEILASAVLTLLRWLEDRDLGNWQRTGAGLAWSNWRHAHYTHEVICHGDAELQGFEESSTYTGRCEAWRWGEIKGGPFIEWDLPLAYARVCLDTELPVRLGRHVTSPPIGYVLPPRPGRRCLVRARVHQTEPVLPTHYRDRTIWPVGTIEGWWWDLELAEALAEGAQVTPIEAWTYPAEPALADWARWVVDTVDGRDPDVSPVCRLAVKHWSRALIGRFSSRYRDWQPFAPSIRDTVETAAWIDLDEQTKGWRLTLGRETFLAMGETYGMDAFPAVQAVVMAEARRRLWRIMRAAGLEHVVYVDTDSAITDRIGSARLRYLVDHGELWGLRAKRHWTDLTVVGPRQLVLDDLPRFAGIPYGARRRANGDLVGDRWEGFEESLRRGRADRVTISATKFHPKGTDRRRTHRPGGRTEARAV